MNKNSYVIIMAGGTGSRFWPMSTNKHPKQFMDIFGTGKTLIQNTYERFSKICLKENMYVLTNEAYVDLVQKQLPEIEDHQILQEPIMRNTAPCIAYGCFKIQKYNPSATVVVTPSDHLILDELAFADAIHKALVAASKKDCLLTLGIKASRPDTGYGYIQFTRKKCYNAFYKVKTFTEKPTLEMATMFINRGDFLWNSGIFIWSVKAIIEAFRKYLPNLYGIFTEGQMTYNTKEEQSFIKRAYQQLASISIDYGIMEKATNVYVLPTQFPWSDLGTWEAVYQLIDKDKLGNALISSGKMILHNTSNCVVNASDNKLVILQGLHNFIVVESNNILFISPRGQEQRIKQIMADVKQQHGYEFI